MESTPGTARLFGAETSGKAMESKAREWLGMNLKVAQPLVSGQGVIAGAG